MTESKEQRMTLAGSYVIEGLSFKQALKKAGYSESVARCPKANKLSAKRCVELALKDGKQALPAALRSSARELLQKKLDAAKDDPESVSLTAAARATEVVEKVYSHSDDGDKERVRPFAERLRWMAALFAEMRRRGMDPAIEQPVPIEGVVIDAEPEDSGASED